MVENKNYLSVFLIFFMCDVFLNFVLERETEHEWRGGAERERERERKFQRFHAQHRVRQGIWFHNPGIMTWVKIKSWTLNQLTPPSVFLYSKKEHQSLSCNPFKNMLPHILQKFSNRNTFRIKLTSQCVHFINQHGLQRLIVEQTISNTLLRNVAQNLTM